MYLRMKKFVLTPGKKYYFFNFVHDKDIYIEEEPFLTNSNKIKNIIMRVIKKIGLWRLYLLFLKGWKDKLKQSDSCVIFDQAFSPTIVKVIHNFNPLININIYIWNPVLKDKSIIKKIDKVKEMVNIYSFDKNDCKKYGFSFSPMIYDFNSKIEKGIKLKYDVIFVGYLKNRSKLLIKLYNYLEKNKVDKFFYVLDNINYTEEVPFELKDRYLDYKTYKKLMLSSKAVLDIVQEGQIGLTIRTMEAICYQKKLITNNKDIMTYDFYNKNNIFVLGVDDIESLIHFINMPFEKIDKEIIEKYNFSDWVKSFKA